MALYSLSVVDRSGKKSLVQREAESEETLLGQLARDGLYAVSPIGEASSGNASSGLRVSRKAVELFTDSLSVMLSSGLSVKDALSILSQSGPKSPQRRLSLDILDRIKGGSRFAGALAAAAPGFPSLYLSLVRLGERVGSLESVLTELSRHLHAERNIRDKIAQALLYPALVMTTALVGVVLFLALLVPRIAAMVGELGPTALGRLDHTLRGVRIGFGIGGAVVLLLVLAVFGLWAARRQGAAARERVDRFLLRLPLAGNVMLRRSMVNLAFAVEILTANGVPVEEALEEASKVVGNASLRRDLADIRHDVKGGDRLSDAFSRRSIFPERVTLWIGIGERTGTTEKVFRQIRIAYQAELETTSAKAIALIEPAVTLIAGLLVLSLVLTLIVPLFELFGTLI